jgi:hypothetical protein
LIQINSFPADMAHKAQYRADDGGLPSILPV